MKEETLTYILLGISFISLAKASIDWSKYTRNVHHNKSYNEVSFKKTTKKIGISSIITGTSFGFLGTLIPDTSSMFASYKIGFFLSIPIALIPGLIWTSIYLGGFLLKAYTLKSMYKETETD